VLVSILVTLASRIYKGGHGPSQNRRSPDHPTPKAIQTTTQDVGYYAPHGPNLSKFCVPCTFEFLISASPHLKLTTLGISLGGQPVKHRQLARQVGERIEDTPANSMASFQLTSRNQLRLVELHQQTVAKRQEAQLVTQQQQMADGSLGTYYTY
jgi:hypothetical protein